MAGPNAGGILVVHDTGVAFSTDTPLPPVSEPPASCGQLDLQAEPGFVGIWKVYAVFPTGSSPHLKGVSWGIHFNLAGGSGVVVNTAGLSNPGDFEVTQGGWPNTSDASIGEAFSAGTRLGQIEECYWFAGYGYLGGAGEPAFFCTQPHAVQPPQFVDDGYTGTVLRDDIAGFGCLGFGAPGSAPCPPEPGACCVYDEAGTCLFIYQTECIGPDQTWHGGPCDPNPCPLKPPTGSCCTGDDLGTCLVTEAAACTGVWTFHGVCDPNPCPIPTGACCTGAPDWLCTVTIKTDCAFLWIRDGVCAPTSSCPPEPIGSCCYHDGSCTVETSRTCVGGIFTVGGVCLPNTCAQPSGACCAASGICSFVPLANCPAPTVPWVMDAPCDPNPCPQPAYGACCIYGWINGQLNHCVISLEPACYAYNPANVWFGGLTCDPLPCNFVPTEQKTWGEIKNIYR